MGIKIFSENSSSPNPDPYAYTIIEKECVGDYQIVTAKYHGCTTFDGVKLMLIRGSLNDKLDPHLLGNGHNVIARFEPTGEGKLLARLCANFL